MGFADFYFERQKKFEVKIHQQPQANLKYSIVIPCFNEFNVLDTLNSLWDCKRPRFSAEVLIVINSADYSNQDILDQNSKTYSEVNTWIETHEGSLLQFFVIWEKNLPKKYAGAGLARKIGMDQAVFRFNSIGQDKGVIISLDADALVKSNYLTELEKNFSIDSKINAATIYFEHPLHGSHFTDETYHAITIYELYIRYYKLALSFTGFPYSYYTIGSCFAVSALRYAQQGGMNKKQAGEDFYFLQKIFPLGNINEVNTTCVYPSPRPSDRVPFGTGPMVRSIIESKEEEFLAYNFDSFLELKSFIAISNSLYRISIGNLNRLLNKLPICISTFLLQNDVHTNIGEINNNSSNVNTFKKRFFDWFNAFRVLKFLNFAHEGYYEKQPLLKEVEVLLLELKHNDIERGNYKKYLEIVRNLEKNS